MLTIPALADTNPPSVSAVDASNKEIILIDMLRQRALISEEGIERVRSAARSRDIAFSAAATRLGIVAEKEIARIFSSLLNIEIADKARYPHPCRLPAALNPAFLRKHKVLPLAETNRVIQLAMANPMDDVAAEGVAFAVGKTVQRLAALESDIEEQLQSIRQNESKYSDEDDAHKVVIHNGEDIDKLSDHDSDAPAIRLAHRLITQAMDLGASDIHLEPAADALIVRYRVDGLLQEAETLSNRWSQPIISRLKLMARLDIAEKRLPQDGRIHFTTRGMSFDLRVATFPTLHGESMVLRLLGQHSVSPELDHLDLDPVSLKTLCSALKRPHGIVLVTGPTGSGKTTTLYAALNTLLQPEVKIITVEDPIEYTLTGVSQLQIKPEIGLTYGAALRSVLRNDPDVIMIGEIRDRETAEIAIRAALTGHLVLATLHTNTAAGAITRLLDLGVEDYLLASTLIFSAAQRLVRRLCTVCRSSRPVTTDELALLSSCLDADRCPDRLPEAAGCSACKGRGYIGRLPLFEALPIGPEERALIREFRSEQALLESAARQGMSTLWQHGLQRVIHQETTMDEILSTVEVGIS